MWQIAGTFDNETATAGSKLSGRQVIPGFFAIDRPHEIDRGWACIDFSIVVHDEVHEGTLLRTAQERVGQYLWHRPDVQPVQVKAQAQERLPESQEPQLPPEHMPPRRFL